MLLLHAVFSDSRFFVWGETPLAERESPAKEEPDAVHLCQFDAGVRLITQVLAEIIGDDSVTNFRAERLSLWLPTRRKKALASSPLIDESLDPKQHAGLQIWDVSAVELSPDATMRFLEVASSTRVWRPGVIFGPDVQFFSRVVTFAAGLALRQSFMPGLLRAAEGWHAVWQPVIAGSDMDALLSLVAACPDICRSAVVDESEDVDDQPGALRTIHDFITVIIDHVVRQSAPQATVAPATTTADAWLNALRARHDSLIARDEKELDRLKLDIAKWKRPLNAFVNAPFRLCFRLEEPERDEQLEAELSSLGNDVFVEKHGWRISYLLQSTSDPSLLVDAGSIWRDSNKSNLMIRTRFGAREYLLASLGAASMLYPAVESSLLSAAPSYLDIDVDEAYRFLTQHADMLQAAGFSVMLPTWWTRRPRRRLGAKASVANTMKAKDGKLSLDKLVDFRWQVALGDKELSKSDLEELARLKVPLINVRGQWMEINPDQLNAAIDFVKSGKNAISLRELIQLSLGSTSLPTGMEFGGIAGGGWVQELIDRLQGDFAFAEEPAPSGFRGSLRPYQVRGYSWMNFLTRWSLGACLADDMGLGKTVQTLALIQKRWQESEPEDRRPVLLICPMSVVGNWHKEAQRFTPELPIMIHHGVTRTKGDAFVLDARKHAIVVSSYALMVRDLEFLNKVYWSGVILDEAQNIKNAETPQSKPARSGLSDYKIALTGTPVENNVGDLWSIMEFLNRGLLGSQKAFKRTFLVPIQVDKDESASAQLKHITRPFILRRLKTDKDIITDLPQKLEIKDYCNLTKEQASLYRGVLRDMEDKIASTQPFERAGLVLATLSKLKQICNHPAQFLHDNSAIDGRSGKLMRLTEMLDESLQVDDHVLIFSQFAEMGEIIKTHLQNTFGQEALFLHGAVPKAKRDAMVERFQNDADGPRLFILSLKAGGTGLNLTRANQVIHFDRWWNPAVENQATDRAFRIGQKRNVQVHKFVCIGTLEDKIDQIIEEKQKVAESIVGTGEGWLTELNDDQLRQLLTLTKEAVSE